MFSTSSPPRRPKMCIRYLLTLSRHTIFTHETNNMSTLYMYLVYKAYVREKLTQNVFVGWVVAEAAGHVGALGPLNHTLARSVKELESISEG